MVVVINGTNGIVAPGLTSQDSTGTVTLTTSTLVLGGTTVTATASELNILDGVTSTAAELNKLDGVTATTAEINYLDITTLGTSQASKVVTADANGDVVISEELLATSYNEKHITVTSSGNSVTINCETGNNFFHTLTENTTFTFSNPPPGPDISYAFSLKVKQDTAASGYTVTWPASVAWPTASAPTLTADSDATDIFVFQTHTNGTLWYGFVAGQAMGVPV